MKYHQDCYNSSCEVIKKLLWRQLVFICSILANLPYIKKCIFFVQFAICLTAALGGFMFGIHWTMPSVVGPQWIIGGQKATPSEISWFGNIIVCYINHPLTYSGLKF